jgi:hypothetical protein
MRSPDEVFQELEQDRATREREIRLIENSARKALTDNERDMLFRVSVLITYAHLEGFCKFALTAYVSAVNSMKLSCKEASFALVAITLTKLFSALRNPNSKHPAFARKLPDDSKLHLVAREREFIEKFESLIQATVELPDQAVDTESNLSSVVLKKNLFKLGLSYPIVDERKGDIDMLLGVRNAIAHGDALKVPQKSEVENYVKSAFLIMQFVQHEIFTALKEKAYLRTKAA